MFLWFAAVAPAVAVLAIAITAAVAWCAWLDKNPDISDDRPHEPSRHSCSTTTPGRPSVHVLATTVEGTERALSAAKAMRRGSDARVVLLVPKVLSAGQPFDPTGRERFAIVDEHRALAARVGVDATVLFCLCHSPDDVVCQMLDPTALLIVGGRRGTWLPSCEERLADRLIVRGHPVVFAQVPAESAPVRLAVTTP
jgi:hypothetical protein